MNGWDQQFLIVFGFVPGLSPIEEPWRCAVQVDFYYKFLTGSETVILIVFYFETLIKMVGFGMAG